MESSIAWLYLILAGFADAPCDLLTFLEPAEYFEARHVAVTAEKMTELAAREPKDRPAEIARLLAIRWLGENRVGAARDVLGRLARGPNAGDRHGFAQDYARRALARIDGRPFGRGPTRANWLRDGLAWFPEEVSWVGAVDLKVSWASKPFTLPGGGQMQAQAAGGERPAAEDFVLRPAVLAGRNPEDLSRWVERFGNVELSRVVVGQLPAVRPGEKTCSVVRLTGGGDHGALVDYFRRLTNGGALVAWEARHGTPPITIVRDTQVGFALAFIGDTDIVLAGGSQRPGDDLAALQAVLEVRAGRKSGVLRGPLALYVAEVPDNASALLAGELPSEAWQNLTGKSGFPTPTGRIVLDLTVDETASINLRFWGGARTSEEARVFAGGVRQWRDRRKADLAALGSARSLRPLRDTLDSLRVEVEGKAMTGRARVSGDVPPALGQLFPAALSTLVQRAADDALKDVVAIACYAVLGVTGILGTGAAVFLIILLVNVARRRRV